MKAYLYQSPDDRFTLEIEAPTPPLDYIDYIVTEVQVSEDTYNYYRKLDDEYWVSQVELSKLEVEL
jgi:hypothetical protein